MENASKTRKDHLEWEFIKPDIIVTSLTFKNGLYNLRPECVIKFERNDQYQISAAIEGVVEKQEDLEPNTDQTRGQFVPYESITGLSKGGKWKYEFLGIVIGGSNCKINPPNWTSVKFTAQLAVSKIVTNRVEGSSETDVLLEWFLTGRSNFIYPQTTARRENDNFHRYRLGIDIEPEDSFPLSGGTSRDCLHIKYGDTGFIVAKVPQEYGPEWSNNLVIEYRKSFGRIPDEIEREAISEIVGFVFGNQLLKIGQSCFDSSLKIQTQEFQNPWGDNVVSRCGTLGLPPMALDNHEDWGRVQILIGELINPYLEKRTELGLKDILWKYWLAKYSSLGTNLPILSSALETLGGNILKAHPKVAKNYVEPKEFAKLIESELLSISAKLDEHPKKQVMLNKISGASQRGSNEKIEMAFEIIGLKVGGVERKAMKARNRMAHASLGDVNDKEIQELIRLTRAYETLFNRFFLKTLSYQGQYTDYYTFGHPFRNIEEEIPI